MTQSSTCRKKKEESTKVAAITRIKFSITAPQPSSETSIVSLCDCICITVHRTLDSAQRQLSAPALTGKKASSRQANWSHSRPDRQHARCVNEGGRGKSRRKVVEALSEPYQRPTSGDEESAVAAPSSVTHGTGPLLPPAPDALDRAMNMHERRPLLLVAAYNDGGPGRLLRAHEVQPCDRPRPASNEGEERLPKHIRIHYSGGPNTTPNAK